MAPNRSSAASKAKPAPEPVDQRGEVDTNFPRMIYSVKGDEKTVEDEEEYDAWKAKGWLDEPNEKHSSQREV